MIIQTFLFLFSLCIHQILCDSSFTPSHSSTLSSHAPIVDSSFSNASRSLITKETIKIVTYNTIVGFLNWHEQFFADYISSKCNTNCIFSMNSNDLKDADVIVFLASTFYRNSPLFPKRPKESTLFVLHTMEQPMYATILNDFTYLKNNFDLLAMYSQESIYPGSGVPNLPLTYYPLHVYEPTAVLSPIKSFKDKNGYGTGVHVVTFISNCKKAGGANRLKFIQELMSYIPVHSYGGCLNNRKEQEIPYDPRWPQHDQRRARKLKTLENYKFYLAFENLGVADYVSEKVYEGLIAGTLPVYRGAESIVKFMPSRDSFINANQMTAKDIADLLIRLSTDEIAYNKYFEYRQQPLSERFFEITQRSYCHPNVLCRLCDYAVAHKEKLNNVKSQSNKKRMLRSEGWKGIERNVTKI